MGCFTMAHAQAAFSPPVCIPDRISILRMKRRPSFGIWLGPIRCDGRAEGKTVNSHVFTSKKSDPLSLSHWARVESTHFFEKCLSVHKNGQIGGGVIVRPSNRFHSSKGKYWQSVDIVWGGQKTIGVQIFWYFAAVRTHGRRNYTKIIGGASSSHARQTASDSHTRPLFSFFFFAILAFSIRENQAETSSLITSGSATSNIVRINFHTHSFMLRGSCSGDAGRVLRNIWFFGYTNYTTQPMPMPKHKHEAHTHEGV